MHLNFGGKVNFNRTRGGHDGTRGGHDGTRGGHDGSPASQMINGK